MISVRKKLETQSAFNVEEVLCAEMVDRLLWVRNPSTLGGMKVVNSAGRGVSSDDINNPSSQRKR